MLSGIVLLCVVGVRLASARAEELLYVVQSNDAGAGLNVVDSESGAIRSAILLDEAWGGGGTADLVASPDGRSLYVLFAPRAGRSRLLAVETATNRIMSTLPFTQSAGRFALTRDGGLAYVIARLPKTSLLRVEIRSLSVTGAVELDGEATDIALSPDGDVAYLTSGFGDGLFVVDTQAQIVAHTVDLSKPPYSLDTRAVALSPSGDSIYALSADRISVIDAATLRVRTEIALGYSPFPLDLAISPDGSVAYVPEANARAIAVIDTATRSPVAAIPLQVAPERVGFSADGRLAWVFSDYSNSLTLIDGRAHSAIRDLQLLGQPAGVAVVGVPALAACGNGQVDGTEECDDGNIVGGDGCASNCTRESVRDFVFDPELSRMRIRDASGSTEVSLSGFERLRIGKASTDGRRPVTVRAEEFQFDPVPIPGVGCVCLWVTEHAGFGPGLGAAGEIGCGPEDVAGVDYQVEQDHHTDDEDPDCLQGIGAIRFGAPIESTNHCLGAPHFQESASGIAGAALLHSTLTMVTMPDGGSCSFDPSDMSKGPDGLPCTSDDPLPRGTADEVRYTTGSAEGVVLDANDVAGEQVSAAATGTPFRCDAAGVSTQETTLAAVIPRASFIYYPIGDVPPPGYDRVVSIELRARQQGPACTGDCNRDREVTVDELVRGLGVALDGLPLRTCLSLDEDLDAHVQIDELIRAVRNALNGCP